MSQPQGYLPSPAPYHGPGGAGAPQFPAWTPQQGEESPKSFLLTWLFATLLGIFGADRFYLAKYASAIAKLLTLGGLGVWVMVDLGLLLFGEQRDRQGRQLRGYREQRAAALTVTGVFLVIGMGAAVTGIVSLPRVLEPSDRSTPAPTVAAPTAQEWAAKTFGDFTPRTFEGEGDGNFEIPEEMVGPAHALVTWKGDSDPEFTIRVVDINDSVSMVAASDEKSSEFAWIQGYSLDTKQVRVLSNGAWSVTLTPIADLPELDMRGTGDGFFLYGGPGGKFSARFSRGDWFSVTQYEEQLFPGTLLTSNETPDTDTPFEKPMRPGPSVVAVSLTDDESTWEFTPEDGPASTAETPPG